MKVIDKIAERNARGERFFSFEYFPPRTEAGVENCFERMDRMARTNPLFCDITWGAGGTTAELTLDMASRMQNEVCVETMMHLTCTNMKVDMIKHALASVKEQGLMNILALRGDPPKGEENWTAAVGGFSCALDLIKYIRQEHGDYFGLACAGYPEAHPDAIGEGGVATAEAYAKDLAYLKEKCDAGAQVIVTQLFYDADVFLQFVDDCRAAGITAEILPGIMPIQTYGGFKRMTGFCKTRVPQSILDALEPIKDNDEAVKAYGVQMGYEMCKKIMDSGKCNGLHMYSLNLERSVIGILERLGMVDTKAPPRALPFRPPTNPNRSDESVRPLFWGNRPKSYMNRTKGWKAYPSSHWNKKGSFEDFKAGGRRYKIDRKEAWGSPSSVEDVGKVFVGFVKGEIRALPWSEDEGLARESDGITARLVELNTRGFLTVNSQPRVNGVDSSTPGVGWGGAGGIVYQRAYLEFFCPRELFERLRAHLDKFPSLSYMATDRSGDFTATNAEGINAVTWGVFPGKEVVQPTVCDFDTFTKVWKDEAFALWRSDWAAVYDEGDAARAVVEGVADSHVLVNIVDNDYVNGDIFAPFSSLFYLP